MQPLREIYGEICVPVRSAQLLKYATIGCLMLTLRLLFLDVTERAFPLNGFSSGIRQILICRDTLRVKTVALLSGL